MTRIDEESGEGCKLFVYTFFQRFIDGPVRKEDMFNARIAIGHDILRKLGTKPGLEWRAMIGALES